MASYKARLREFEEVINEEVINLDRLKTICFNGIPEEQTNRALCWRLLLDYLPPDRSLWKETLERKRNLYSQFIEEMIVCPGERCNEARDETETEWVGEGPGSTPPSPSPSLCDVTHADHPLNANPESQWSVFFKDNEVLLQIDKDVRRLCPDISFFQQPTEFPCLGVVGTGGEKRLHRRVHQAVLTSANVERKGLGITRIAVSRKKTNEDYVPLGEGEEAHWEVVERILFLYAKLNPGQGYVQGMNEIVGPIYHVFASDPHIDWRAHAEADCFFAFTNLMGEIRDFFIKTLDKTELGINKLMERLCCELKASDHEVYMRLQEQELRPQYYSFRWLTLLLSQEFPLPDVLRIWDSLLSDPHRRLFSFLIHVCCAMILLLREEILENDFPTNVKLLQRFPPMDIQIVLSKAVQLSKWRNGGSGEESAKTGATFTSYL